MENTRTPKQTIHRTIKAYFSNGQSLVVDVSAGMSDEAILDYFLHQTFNLTPNPEHGGETKQRETLTKCIKVEFLS